MHRTCVCAALLGAAVGLCNPLPAAEPTPKAEPKDRTPTRTSRDWNPRRTPVVDAVQRARGAVVNIHSERTVQGPAPDELLSTAPSQTRVNGMGTGIIIDARGYIV